MDDVIVKTIQEDTRGKITLVTIGDREHLIVFTNKGFLRGGEIHDGKQTIVILTGRTLWTYNRSDINWNNCLDEGDVKVIPAGTAHMMKALTDTTMIEIKECPRENPVNYFEPFRKIVEEKRDEK